MRRRPRTERTEPLKAAISETQRRITKIYGSQFEDWDPLIELSIMAADRNLPKMQRFEMLREIIEYWYPKQKALEIDVNVGGPTGVLRVPSADPDAWTRAATAHRERVLDGEFSVEG